MVIVLHDGGNTKLIVRMRVKFNYLGLLQHLRTELTSWHLRCCSIPYLTCRFYVGLPVLVTRRRDVNSADTIFLDKIVIIRYVITTYVARSFTP